MEKISEAVVRKVRMEAQNIIKEAEEKAQEEIEKARKQRETKLQEEKRKMLEEAEEEAARIVAQASIKARQKLSSAKNDVITKIIDKVKQELSEFSSDENYFLNLIREAIDALGADKSRIYVSPKDVSMVRKFLERDKELASKIMEVKEDNFLGGVIAENIDGKLRIDNTYETRFEMLLPKLLPEISKELFEAT
ncbi:MAG TPA: V-type ATP synthase subunit E [Dehalococcoidia bacterium]|nr:V-type ATP synthase subunit E [Dehalococcoidia bacterium]